MSETGARVPSRSRSWLVAIAALALMLTIVTVMFQDDRTVSVPATEGVSAEWLDGRPVFVVRDADGTVRVLDGISPDSPEGFVKVLAWCESSRLFEDLWHGSRFDRTGQYLGGPSPTGMATYEIEAATSVAVTVGELGPAPDRSAGVIHGQPSLGAPCDERTALYLPGHPADPSVVADITVHEPNGDIDLWIPVPDRVLGRIPTHRCVGIPVDIPDGVCSERP